MIGQIGGGQRWLRPRPNTVAAIGEVAQLQLIDLEIPSSRGPAAAAGPVAFCSTDPAVKLQRRPSTDAAVEAAPAAALALEQGVACGAQRQVASVD
ncbi:MAG: hypothetical protein MZV70_17065 [Desulfobacterales bacterium]|nr:hypothetical protein [Desulfobacterales bacterium]